MNNLAEHLRTPVVTLMALQYRHQSQLTGNSLWQPFARAGLISGKQKSVSVAIPLPARPLRQRPMPRSGQKKAKRRCLKISFFPANNQSCIPLVTALIASFEEYIPRFKGTKREANRAQGITAPKHSP